MTRQDELKKEIERKPKKCFKVVKSALTNGFYLMTKGIELGDGRFVSVCKEPITEREADLIEKAITETNSKWIKRIEEMERLAKIKCFDETKGKSCCFSIMNIFGEEIEKLLKGANDE